MKCKAYTLLEVEGGDVTGNGRRTLYWKGRADKLLEI